MNIGKGWLITIIQRVLSDTKNRHHCDSDSPCDPFVRIFINDQKVYETRMVKDNPFAVFMETYTSDKIYPNDSVRMEVWDEDSGTLDGNDPLMSFTRDANASGKGKDSFKRIYLHTRTGWKPEYRDYSAKSSRNIFSCAPKLNDFAHLEGVIIIFVFALNLLK